MLDIGAGDEAEHAILLCNYFLHLKKRAFVALGRANPEGKAAYVLVETDMKVVVNNPESLDLWTWFWPQSITRRVCYLYSPLTGAKYDSSDPLCPMNEVHCVFNNHNVRVMRFNNF
jgi:coiled-coil and C2 domain-containing protein 2A